MKLFPSRRDLWRLPFVVVVAFLIGSIWAGCARGRMWRVKGSSMLPTFPESGFVVLIERDPTPDAGDIVIIRAPLAFSNGGNPVFWLKRVVGVPGDTLQVIGGTNVLVRNGSIVHEPYINKTTLYQEGRTWVLGPSMYFVMGDNRNVSLDSRAVGPIPAESIVVVFGDFILF